MTELIYYNLFDQFTSFEYLNFSQININAFQQSFSYSKTKISNLIKYYEFNTKQVGINYVSLMFAFKCAQEKFQQIHEFNISQIISLIQDDLLQFSDNLNIIQFNQSIDEFYELFCSILEQRLKYIMDQIISPENSYTNRYLIKNNSLKTQNIIELLRTKNEYIKKFHKINTDYEVQIYKDRYQCYSVVDQVISIQSESDSDGNQNGFMQIKDGRAEFGEFFQLYQLHKPIIQSDIVEFQIDGYGFSIHKICEDQYEQIMLGKIQLIENPTDQNMRIKYQVNESKGCLNKHQIENFTHGISNSNGGFGWRKKIGNPHNLVYIQEFDMYVNIR